MHPEFLPDVPALLMENTERVLVVADLHFGIESGLARAGVHVQSRSRARASRVLAAVRETDPDLLLLLGDVKHMVPITSRQECDELPALLDSFRDLTEVKVLPGNHDGGIARFLKDGELLPAAGARIDGAGYLHGHTHPDPDLAGGLLVIGHLHPVVSLSDEVGCSLRAEPAYLYSSLTGEGWGDGTRVLAVPAACEFSGGVDVLDLKESGLGPLARCIDEDDAEVWLRDGTYIGTLAEIREQRGA
ncbi:MAG: metallophosphoesterase [Methanofollis sp.]|uniref:metallophosphoesterase n=1 Tax=Methanofollis sp. TaxID=2052835 RepID=UPI0026359043|nr:metallophosphoesterase [Methanofollis sp.]MDD4254271.1 metallophosphoesterase [Methanofollis sp.]